MPQSSKELGRLRDILAALEEEEQHAIELGTVESKELIFGAIGVNDSSPSDCPSPTRAHTTYSHFVKEHLATTTAATDVTTNTHIRHISLDIADECQNAEERPDSMLSQELARLKVEYEVWHLRGPHLEARYADAAARIATRSATLRSAQLNWGVVGLECSPLAIPDIQRPSSFSNSISARLHTSPPKLWLRSIHGPDATALPPTDSDGCMTTQPAINNKPTTPSYPSSLCVSQRGQVATSEAVNCYIGLERLREEVGYWKLLDSVLDKTLIPEEKHLELGFRDIAELEMLAGSILRMLWDGVWLRVASLIQSEQQRIQMFMAHVPTSKIGAASSTCADASKLAKRDTEKRTLYALQLHHYKSLDLLCQKRTTSSSTSHSATVKAESPSSTTAVSLPVVRIGGVNEGDVPLYPLTAAMEANLLDKLIRLAEATVWLQSVPSRLQDNENDKHDNGSMEFSRNGLSAILHLRDGVEKRMLSNRITLTGSNPTTPSSRTTLLSGCKRSFTALPEVCLYLRSLEEDIDEVLGILRTEGERGTGSETPRWFVGSHDTALTTSNCGVSLLATTN